jgi:hypothetical protein
VPVNQKEERSKEIMEIAQIYAGAMKVVVLDRSLMTAYCGTYREEVLLRIALSPWASRLWTLQEGRLAKSISFFFADKFYETGHVMEELRNNIGRALFFETDIPAWKMWHEKYKDPFSLFLLDTAAGIGIDETTNEEVPLVKVKKSQPPQRSSTTPVRRTLVVLRRLLRRRKPVIGENSSSHILREQPPLSGEHSSFLSRMHEYNSRQVIRNQANNTFLNLGSLPPGHQLSDDIDTVRKFQMMLPTMTQRSTSRLEDETICLSALTGLDLAPILQLSSADDRMRKFLTSISTLPLGILFVEGEKLQGYGQRWIPKSILRGGTPEINQECIVQSDGKLAHTGFGLSQTTFIIRNSGELCFGIQLPDGRRFFVGISPQPGLEISQTEKTYAIIPSKGPLSAGISPNEW